MHRLFERSTRRRQRTLDGPWEFVTDAADTGVEDGYVESFPADSTTLSVPGCWNLTPEFFDHHGPAWYRRSFSLPTETNVRLTFAGVAHDATVWLDGENVASHYGGYTPFDVVAADLEAGEHELVVRADNRRGPETMPKPGTDWFPYGGITREVILEELPDVFVESMALRYDLEGATADVTATVSLQNLGAETTETLELSVGETTVETTLEVPAGESAATLSVTLDEISRWSLEEPTLYDVEATLDADVAQERIGFREVEVTETDILLNGEPVSIRGVNRHEDHPDWGHAVPERIMLEDVKLIENGGFNTIRTSHYPNHPKFLDYCDERGILVIEEIPYWQFDGERFSRETPLERGKTMLTEMIERDRHHPSVFSWSVTNECENEEDGVVEATEALVSVARNADSSRPITLATNNFATRDPERCVEFVDFVCTNSYPGWYGEGDWGEHLDMVRDSYPEKPVVVSEFGGGAIAGERSFDKQKWSEQYQCELLEDAIRTFEATEFVAGFTIWQFCDTRTEPALWGKRPKTKNNKGILDEFRRPKDSYHHVKRLLEEY